MKRFLDFLVKLQWTEACMGVISLFMEDSLTLGQGKLMEHLLQLLQVQEVQCRWFSKQTEQLGAAMTTLLGFWLFMKQCSVPVDLMVLAEGVFASVFQDGEGRTAINGW